MNNSYNYIENTVNNILKSHKINKSNFDIFKLVSDLNIKFYEKELDKDISGLFAQKNGINLITVNSTDSLERKRFTIAHELGHFILHSSNTSLFIDGTSKIMFRNNESSSGKHLQEKEANHFAACLLMPKNMIQKFIINRPNISVKDLSKKFQVSEMAMTFRLANLGYDAGLY